MAFFRPVPYNINRLNNVRGVGGGARGTLVGKGLEKNTTSEGGGPTIFGLMRGVWLGLEKIKVKKIM